MTIPVTFFMRSWSYSSGLAAVMMAPLLIGCTSTPTFSRTVYDDPTLLVRLDSPVLQAAGSGELPGTIAELTAADLAVLLRSVSVQPDISFVSYWFLRKDPQLQPAFPNGDADLLAPHLQVALAKARPDETAVFFLRRTRADGIPLVTTGGLLIQGNQLLVLLANTRRPTTTQRKLETARDVPLYPLGEVDFHFVPGRYQTTLAKHDLPKAMAMTSAPVLSITYGALLADLSQPGRGTARPQTEPDISAATIEEKLHRLKTWHEQGLITDDDYLQKRQEILRRF